MAIHLLFNFSAHYKVDVKDVMPIVEKFLIKGENVDLAFSSTRDKVIFTNKRLICYDVQGLTGSKKELRFFPYSKISSFSIESAGFLDADSDFKIWVSGVGVFGLKFGRGIDINSVGHYISQYIV